jgi:hypothetical protein
MSYANSGSQCLILIWINTGEVIDGTEYIRIIYIYISIYIYLYIYICLIICDF